MADVVAGENPYGLIPALQQGGPIAWFLFAVLIGMSAATWFILFTKWWEQRKMMKEFATLDNVVWKSKSLREGTNKLDANSPYRQISEDGMRAYEHHDGKLTDEIDRHEWVTMSLNRTSALIGHKMQYGLSFLASIGSTSPFIGLLGTVVGIYRALINIGVAGQASIDKVAGPVGEALIMTALGLAVAVPAVLAYNFLNSRNKAVQEMLNTFASDVHGYLLSGSRMAVIPAKPAAPVGAKPAAPVAPQPKPAE
ncbi:MAG: MotA/TolQ/ExbB proton channel family protein [Thermaurantiacus sp.]